MHDKICECKTTYIQSDIPRPRPELDCLHLPRCPSGNSHVMSESTARFSKDLANFTNKTLEAFENI